MWRIFVLTLALALGGPASYGGVASRDADAHADIKELQFYQKKLMDPATRVPHPRSPETGT